MWYVFPLSCKVRFLAARRRSHYRFLPLAYLRVGGASEVWGPCHQRPGPASKALPKGGRTSFACSEDKDGGCDGSHGFFIDVAGSTGHRSGHAWEGRQGVEESLQYDDGQNQHPQGQERKHQPQQADKQALLDDGHRRLRITMALCRACAGCVGCACRARAQARRSTELGFQTEG